jgi:hypothetical protein
MSHLLIEVATKPIAQRLCAASDAFRTRLALFFARSRELPDCGNRFTVTVNIRTWSISANCATD